MIRFFSTMDVVTAIVLSGLALLVLVVLAVSGLLSLQAKERERQRIADEAYQRQRARREEESQYDYRGVKKAPLALRNLNGVPDAFLTFEEREELERRKLAFSNNE